MDSSTARVRLELSFDIDRTLPEKDINEAIQGAVNGACQSVLGLAKTIEIRAAINTGEGFRYVVGQRED